MQTSITRGAGVHGSAPCPRRREPRRAKALSAVSPGSKYAYSMTEAASLLGLSRSTVYQLIGDNSLGSITVGYRRLVTEQQLVDFLECRVAGA